MSVPTSITSFDLQKTFMLDQTGKDQPVDRERLVKMAQEFEGMLLLQMVRQMRQSMLSDGEEGEDDLGLGKATMTDTFDVEFANYLAKQGGIGLSKSIEQQFLKAEQSKADVAALKDAGPQPSQKPLEAAPKSIGLEPPSPLPLSPGRGVYHSAASPSEAGVALHGSATAGVNDGTNARSAKSGVNAGRFSASGVEGGSARAIEATPGGRIDGAWASKTTLGGSTDGARTREAMPSEAAAGEARVGGLRHGGSASDAQTSEAAAGEGHASAIHSEIPPFLGQRGQGGQGEAALSMPLDSDTSSAFGWRSDPFGGRRKFHNGVDLRAAYGTEVPTAAPGKVTFAGERGGYGLLVVVEHPNGVETRYAHLSSAAVQPGDSVAAGQTIGRVGSSGRSTGPHLHFEVLLDGKRVNPEEIASSRPAVATLAQNRQTLAP